MGDPAPFGPENRPENESENTIELSTDDESTRLAKLNKTELIAELVNSRRKVDEVMLMLQKLIPVEAAQQTHAGANNYNGK